jgi:DNA-binding phage protein
MQPITSIAALWQEATTDPEFGFALKAQDVRLDLAAAVARSAMPKSQLAAQLGWTSERLEKALTGSADLSLQTIFAITRALGLDFMVAITTPEPTGEAVKTRPTGNTTKEKKDLPEICPGCGEGHLIRYIEREQVEINGQTWRIPLQFSECDACGAELTNAKESRANVEAMKKIELKAKLHASKQSGSDPNSPVHDEAR